MSVEIGKKIKTLRKSKKMTQFELAEAMNLNRASISNYEVGRRTPHLSELKRFAEFFGVSLDYFGVSSQDEVFELLARAKEVFASDDIPKEKKESLYKEIMKLYLSL